jgi:SPP1 gp7 family putative phage head morphogenesis protein
MNQLNINNFMLQLDYRTPFNKEEQEYYTHICQGLDRQLSQTVEWLQSSEAKEFYREQSEYLDWLWQQYDLENQLDAVINYNASSCDKFMDNFYHAGAMIGYQQLKRGLAYTPADEKTLNFIRTTDYGYIKKLNNDVKDSIRKTIFEDIAQGNSYQKTINKIRKLPLEPVANGRLSPDVRARMIARTERARARGFGTLQSYANYGVEYYELITRGKKACNICIDLEKNNPYPITDPTAFIPIHPNCICSVGPHIPDGQTLSSTPVDFPFSISDYTELTMQTNRTGGLI